MPLGIVCAACLEDVPGALNWVPRTFAPDCVCDACKEALVRGEKTLEQLGKPYWDRQRKMDSDHAAVIPIATTLALNGLFDRLGEYNTVKHKGVPKDVLEGRRRLQMLVGVELLKREHEGA